MSISSDSITTIVQEYFKAPLVTVVVGDTSEIFNAPAWEGYSIKELVDTVITIDELEDFNK